MGAKKDLARTQAAVRQLWKWVEELDHDPGELHEYLTASIGFSESEVVAAAVAAIHSDRGVRGGV
jgi:hypothetical protein